MEKLKILVVAYLIPEMLYKVGIKACDGAFLKFHYMLENPYK